MIVTAWKNGRHSDQNLAYGIRINPEDRDIFFMKSWSSIDLSLPDRNDFLNIAITPSFWKECHELRHPSIGQWFRENNHTPWEKGCPPKFVLKPVRQNQFTLRPLID